MSCCVSFAVILLVLRQSYDKPSAVESNLTTVWTSYKSAKRCNEHTKQNKINRLPFAVDILYLICFHIFPDFSTSLARDDDTLNCSNYIICQRIWPLQTVVTLHGVNNAVCLIFAHIKSLSLGWCASNSKTVTPEQNVTDSVSEYI